MNSFLHSLWTSATPETWMTRGLFVFELIVVTGILLKFFVWPRPRKDAAEMVREYRNNPAAKPRPNLLIPALFIAVMAVVGFLYFLHLRGLSL